MKKLLSTLFYLLIFTNIYSIDDVLEYPNQEIICVGNSLTAGAGGGGITYPKVLATLTGLKAVNFGVGGQTSTQIAARFGAIPILVSVEGNQIPASGSVPIISKTVNILYNSGRYMGSQKCTLSGIRGTISTDDLGNWTFSRETSGEIVDCPQNTSIIVESKGYENDIAIFWIGRNNYYQLATVMNDIKSCVNYLKPMNKRFLVLSIINGQSEIKGSGGYNKIISLNDSIRAAYPDNYIDVRSSIIESYQPENKIDSTDHSNDVPPASLRYDAIHLTGNGYTIVANKIFEIIKSKGWVITTNNNIHYSKNQNISIYPNPVVKNLVMTFTDDNTAKNIFVSDISGKRIFNKILPKEITNSEIDFSEYKPGLYLIYCNNTVTKVIKQ